MRQYAFLLYTGIRISECAALNLADVYAQGRKNRIIIRNGKGGRHREVPLNGEACVAIQTWLQERAKKFDGKETAPALFINQQGRRMSTSALGPNCAQNRTRRQNRAIGSCSPAHSPYFPSAQRQRPGFGGRNRGT